MEIIVKGLNFNASESDLKRFFEDSGFEVKNVKIILDRETHKSRGFAFVTINDEDQALRAIEMLNGNKMMGRSLSLAESKPREERGNNNSQPKNFAKPEVVSQREHQSASGSNFDSVIPKRTADAVKGRTIDNLHLKLNAFAEMSGGKFELPKGTLSTKIPNEVKALFDSVRNQKNIVVNEFEAETASRLIVGLGSESVYEVSMTLHHIYGIPYIPGQSLKGAVRNFIISEKFDKDEKKALQDEDFCSVFGKQDDAGKIIFYDVYPDGSSITLEHDIMTPHYPDYYGGSAKWPTDTQSPNPIKFLTVKKGVKFKFFLGTKKGDAVLLDKAAEYLKEALEKSGVGAKTAVGYGYFKFNG